MLKHAKLISLAGTTDQSDWEGRLFGSGPRASSAGDRIESPLPGHPLELASPTVFEAKARAALASSGNAAGEPRGIIRTADAREGLRAFSREATTALRRPLNPPRPVRAPALGTNRRSSRGSPA